MATKCPACGAELVLAVRQLDRQALSKAARARWHPPRICAKCHHAEGCDLSLGCDCTHDYGGEKCAN